MMYEKWPKGVPSKIWIGGKEIGCIAYYGMADRYAIGNKLADTSGMPYNNVERVPDGCPVCGSQRSPKNVVLLARYDGYQTKVITYSCGSLFAYACEGIILYSASYWCLDQSTDTSDTI